MKKFISAALILSMAAAFAVMPASVSAEGETETITYNYNLEGAAYKVTSDHTRQMEKLDRGLVAIKTTSGVYLSWRLFDSEDTVYGSAASNVTFNVYRNGTKITDEPIDATNYTDATAGTSYQVAPVVDGVEGEKCGAVTVYSNSYFDIDLTARRPAAANLPKYVTENKWHYFVDSSGNKIQGNDWRNSATAYEDKPYEINDCSTGDLDGDGEYEIVVKWDADGQDNSYNGVTGNVFIDAFKLDGTPLWNKPIDLGKNIRAGAHYTQFLVYDFDSDGKAEITMKTAPGSKDASDAYVTQASHISEIAALSDTDNEVDLRDSGGFIMTGDEYFTIFDGETGNALDTIYYPTARISASVWGDTNGNRLDRYVAGVAYLDGKKPYAVYLRGYYFGRNDHQRTGIFGVSFNGNELSADYQFDTERGQPGYYDGAYQYVGNGNHNCTVADVDNDGKDEFITGALCMEVNDDNEFKPRWCTYRQHGDALHIGDYDPTHKGLEFFTVHEDGDGINDLSGTDVTLDFGMSVIDADTGEMIRHWSSGSDNGRGIMANIGAGGYYQITSANAGTYRADGGSNFTAANGNYGMSQNFRIFWDGDLYDELLDGVRLTNWNGRTMAREVLPTNTQFGDINSTKANPCLQADILGDWREEIIYRTNDNNKLRVFIPTAPTEYKIKTLMQDPVYRSGVAAEQTAYNQPPHVGFYMGEEMFKNDITALKIEHEPTKKVYVIGEPLDTEGLVVKATYEDGAEETVTAYNLSGYDSDSEGEKTVTVEYKGITATFKVTVLGVNKIELTAEPTKTDYVQGEQLDLSGMVVTATYSDNSTAVIDSSEYKISGFIPSQIGEQTVTVEYGGQTATFKVTVREASVDDLNGDYENASTTQNTTQIRISPFTGAYVLEHTFTINTMPAAGNINNKGTVSGFTLRFMSDAADNVKEGTGGGWTLVPNSDKTAADVYWKSGSNDAARLTTNAPIKLGETYTVRYAFTNVATGSGARVKMYVIDSNGNTVMEKENLDLRNFTNDNQKAVAINRIDITMQAASNGAPASVTIGGAKITLCGVVYVDGSKVSVNLNNDREVNSVRAYAVKYANGTLTNVADVTPDAPGERVSTLNFEPDKIYVWSNMQPVDLWVKPQQ